MDRNEVWKMLQEREKQHERNQLMRFAKMVLFYAAVFCGIRYLQGGFANFYWLHVLGEILACIVVAGVFVLFSSIIFWQVFEANEGEKRALERLRLELAQLEREAEQHRR